MVAQGVEMVVVQRIQMVRVTQAVGYMEVMAACMVFLHVE